MDSDSYDVSGQIVDFISPGNNTYTTEQTDSNGHLLYNPLNIEGIEQQEAWIENCNSFESGLDTKTWIVTVYHMDRKPHDITLNH